jgi:hypothetical protein
MTLKTDFEESFYRELLEGDRRRASSVPLKKVVAVDRFRSVFIPSCKTGNDTR